MNIVDSNKLKFAIPGKGRLKDSTVDLLKRAGFNFRTRGRDLYASCTNEDIIFIFVRADDIPVLVAKGVVDLGITGSDLIIEKKAKVESLLSLGYGKCRLCIAVQESHKGNDFDFFNGKTIATSFPVMTREFFKSKGVDVQTVEMNGSVEIMVALNIADAIVDIVETGDSLRDNHLKVFTDIGNYQATLIVNEKISQDDFIQKITRRLNGILLAKEYSLLEYNISGDKLEDAEKITPGFESPTVAKLDQENWYSVKVMVQKKKVVSVMDALESLGATAILETNISNCRL